MTRRLSLELAPAASLACCALLVLACASAPPPGTAVTTGTATKPCNVPVPASDLPWRLVETPNFTFCLPSGWRQVAGREWRGDGTISWGGATAGEVKRVPFVIGRVTSDGVRSEMPVRSISDRTVEEIGGRTAELWIIEVDARAVTGVKWDSPSLTINGQAPSRTAGRLHLAIYRTVRFTDTGTGK